MSFTLKIYNITHPPENERYVDYAVVSVNRAEINEHVASFELSCFELALLLALPIDHQFQVNEEFTIDLNVVRNHYGSAE